MSADQEKQPYAEYTVQVEAEGYEKEEVAGTEVLPKVLAKQPVLLAARNITDSYQRIVIPPHTLFGDYPPKIEEAEVKPIEESGEYRS